MSLKNVTSKPAKMNRVAIVTGASSGIGLSIALRLGKEGYQTVAWDIQPPSPEHDLPYIQCDVSSESAVKNAYAEVKAKFGSCDLLVNNCGLQYMAPIEDYPLEKWNLLIGVLLTGTFLCSREVFADMKKQNSGRIVNISSVHGKVASPFKAAYVSAKHGVLGLSKVLAMEGAEHGITVNSICPGFVDTPLMRNQVTSQMKLNNLPEEEVLNQIFLKTQNIKKLTTPEQVADMVAFLASESASTITGEAFNISGGWAMGY
jgi:3-hydroxybutyrate dehydrogenase